MSGYPTNRDLAADCSVLVSTLDGISSDQVIKATPNRNEDTDAAGLWTTVPKSGKTPLARAYRSEDIA
jgi:hypothetical protein